MSLCPSKYVLAAVFPFSLLSLEAYGASQTAQAPRVITVWEDQHKSGSIMPMIEKFEKENNCTVLLKEKKAALQYDKLKEGKDGIPDVFILVSDRLTEAATEGRVEALDFMKEQASSFDESAIKAVSFADRIYASPRSIETLMVYYNLDLINYPFETLEEYKNFSKMLKSTYSDKYGLIGDFTKFYYSNGFILGNGGYVFGKNTNGTANIFDVGLNNSNALKGVKELISYVEECVPKEALSKKADAIIDMMFIKGYAAAVVNGPWAMEKYAREGVNFSVAPLPKLANGKSISPFYGVKGYAIPAESKNKDLAAKLISFLNEPSNAQSRYFANAELPPIKQVLNDSYIAYDDMANCILSEVKNTEPMPSVAKMRKVWEQMDIALYDVLNDKVDEKVALNNAVKAIRYSD
ncbi:MAG: extracellular solute-binding protein [Succinivibrio sp.]